MLRRAAYRNASLFAGLALISFLGCSRSAPTATPTRAPFLFLGIDKPSLRDSKVICTGAITSDAWVLSVPPFWEKWMRSDHIQGRALDFLVDGVIKGEAGLAGKTVRIWYVAEKPFPMWGLFGGMYAGPRVPDFREDVGAGNRCLVCLDPAPDAPAGTYVIASMRSYMFVGKKPTAVGWENLTTEERLAREVTAAILDTDNEVAKQGMWVAGNAPAPEVVDALHRRMSEPDRDIAAGAIASLVRLNDLPTIYRLTDLLAAWSDDEHTRKMVGGSVRRVTDLKAVPAIVPFLDDNSAEVREGAAYALREIRSEKGVAALIGALGDPNEWVSYHAVMGLYNRREMDDKSGWYKPEEHWAPSLDLYRQDPERSVRIWKEWWEQEGKGKYPSKEAVLEEFKTEKARLLKGAPHEK